MYAGVTTPESSNGPAQESLYVICCSEAQGKNNMPAGTLFLVYQPAPIGLGLNTRLQWTKVNQGVATSNRVRGVTTPENYSGSDTPIYDWNLNSMNVGGAGQ